MHTHGSKYMIVIAWSCSCEFVHSFSAIPRREFKNKSKATLLTIKMSVQPRRRWWHIQWYSNVDTKEEKKLILKLDLLFVPYAVLSYWVKYIDQANLSVFANHPLSRIRS